MAAVLGAYLAWGGLAFLVAGIHAYSSQTEQLVNGRLTEVTQEGSTVYQANPESVTIVLGLLGVALLVATASVVWRIFRRSERVGVTGMIVAAVSGVVALLGMLTIGPFIAPLAVLLVVIALPIAPDRGRRPPPPQPGFVPPGWYKDPGGLMAWRYWDGSIWTEHQAPMRVG